MGQVSILFGQLIRGLSAGARIAQCLSLRPSIPITGGLILPLDEVRGDLTFHGVGFAYPTRPRQTVLEDFSLSIPPGKVVALCGESGGGKSTIAALVERFYDVRDGRVTLDGHDIRELDPSWYRGRVLGFINQEPVLFATSIMENIRYGNPDATDEQVMEAARQANADGFIRGFPAGYRTVLGERGATVSGGQKQRIAIARALVKNPKVLVLDEATSALDSESERVVQDTLDDVMQGRTVLVIAHRLSTIRNADLIAVVDSGRIVETGTHSELLRKGGAYWRLVQHEPDTRQVRWWTKLIPFRNYS